MFTYFIGTVTSIVMGRVAQYTHLFYLQSVQWTDSPIVPEVVIGVFFRVQVFEMLSSLAMRRTVRS